MSTNKLTIPPICHKDVLFMGTSLCMVTLCASSIAWTAYAVFICGDASVYAENSALETLQALFIAAACLLYLACMEKVQGRLILLACSLLCYSFLVRELDVEQLDVPVMLQVIGSGVVRNASIAIGFATLLVCACARFSYYKDAVKLFLKSHCGLLLVTGGVLLGLGDIFEKSHSIYHNAFYEEAFELCGYVAIALSALKASAGNWICYRHR